MYFARLLVRSFSRGIPPLEQCVAFSSKPRPNEVRRKRPVNANKSKQVAGIKKQVKPQYTSDQFNADAEDEELNLGVSDQLYDAHFGELKWRHRRRGLAEYSQKYYKAVQEPPLLSYEDMTQIRKLFKSENWPVSVLAKSFPANETIIEKVLQSDRNMSLEEQFEHDKKVAENWILLRRGKLKISDPLRLHCSKFSDRQARPTTSRDVAVMNKEAPKPAGMFLNLIHPPRKKEDTEADERKQINPNDGDPSDSCSTIYHLRKKITLEEIRKAELKQVADRDMGASEEEKLFLYGPNSSIENKSKGSEKDNYVNPTINYENSVSTKSKTGKSFVSKWDSAGNTRAAARQMMMAPYDELPERIDIPEMAKKPGALYRVEDCFYDETGEFLYRVPGFKF